MDSLILYLVSATTGPGFRGLGRGRKSQGWARGVQSPISGVWELLGGPTCGRSRWTPDGGLCRWNPAPHRYPQRLPPRYCAAAVGLIDFTVDFGELINPALITPRGSLPALQPMARRAGRAGGAGCAWAAGVCRSGGGPGPCFVHSYYMHGPLGCRLDFLPEVKQKWKPLADLACLSLVPHLSAGM